MGLIKDWNESTRQLKDIDERLQELDASFALGEVKKIKNELGELSMAVEVQLRARRAYAYRIAEQANEKEAMHARIPADKLEEVNKLNITLTNKGEVISAKPVRNISPRT